MACFLIMGAAVNKAGALSNDSANDHKQTDAKKLVNLDTPFFFFQHLFSS